jgi:hypothetical protein
MAIMLKACGLNVSIVIFRRRTSTLLILQRKLLPRQRTSISIILAPDYAWWRGFYELKKRCMVIEEQAEQLLKSGKPAKVFDVQSSNGDTTMPDFQK